MKSLKEPEQSQHIMVPTLAYLTCLMITGIIGNSVVCIVYYKKFPYSTTRFYILVMSVFDLLTNVVAMPVELMFGIRYDLDSSDFECKAFIAVKAAFTTFSGFVLIAVAIDRYRKVCRTTKKQLNEKKAVGVCAFLTIFTAVPTTLVAGRHTLHFEGSNVTGMTCFVADDFVDSTFLMVYASSMVVMLSIGSMVMSAAYARIAHYLLMHRKHMEVSGITKFRHVSTITRNTITRSLHMFECPTGAPPASSLGSAVDNFMYSPQGPPPSTALSSDMSSSSPVSQRTQVQMPLSTGLASTTQTHGGPSRSPIQPAFKSVIGGNEEKLLCVTFGKGAVEDVRVPETEATSITTSAGKEGKAGKTATEPADGRQDIERKTQFFSLFLSPEEPTSQSVDGFVSILRIASMDTLAHTNAWDTEQTAIASTLPGDVTESAEENKSALSDKINSKVGLEVSSATDDKSLFSLKKNCLTKPESEIATENKNVMSDEIITSENRRVSTTMSRHIIEQQSGLSCNVLSLSRSVSRIPTHTTLMMYILTAVFVINFLPYLTLIIVYRGGLFPHNTFQIFVRSYFINSSLNPFVYCFCSAKFRTECFKLFTFRFKFADSSSIHQNTT